MNIVLVSGTEASAQALTRQLQGYLEGQAEVQTWWLDGAAPQAVRGPLDVPTDARILF